MSQETRKKHRIERKSSRIKILILAVFCIAVLLIVIGVKDKQAILKKSVWTKDIDARFYFFKAVSDAEVDDFNAKTITVEPGGKTNGYTVLASQDLTVNVAWTERQKTIIQSLINKNASEDWKSIIEQVIISDKGALVIDSVEVTISDIAPYVGMTADQLNEKLGKMTELAQGNPISITLNNLDLIRSGAVYTSTTKRRRTLNENFLPYLSTALLSAVDSADKSSRTALTVVDNDHVFAVTALDSKTEIAGEDQTAALKTKNLSETGTAEKDYYSLLVNRDDLVRQYPSLNMTVSGQTTQVYLIDSKTEDRKKILVLMIRNNTNLFLREDRADGNLEIQRLSAYVVPKTAVKNVSSGIGQLTLMERSYFPKETAVNITTQDGSDYVLSAADNESLSEGGIYKVFP